MKIYTKQRMRDTRKKRVAAYCRVSTLLESQEDSLEVQARYYTAYIEANPDWEYAGIYYDSKTGTDASRRSGFQRMIDKACNGQIDTILTKSISRFSRNIVDTLHYVDVLRSHGVNVIFEKESINSENPSSSMIFSFLAAIAQNESYSISANMRAANKKRFASGKYTAASHECFGYKAVDNKLVPDENAKVVRAIYAMFLEGTSIREISRRLKCLGIVGTFGKPLTDNGVRYILKNETYVGDKELLKSRQKDLFYKGDIEHETFFLPDDHEPIVSRGDWETVQQKLSEVDERKYTGGKPHYLHDKLVCHDCGEKMTRRTVTGKGGQKTIVWTCTGRHHGRKGNGCKMRNVPETEIMTALSEALDVEFAEENIDMVSRVMICQDGIVVEKA